MPAGKQSGRRPFGSTEAEQEIVKLIMLKRRRTKSGKRPSLHSIARDLNALGHRTKTGKLWRAQGVKDVIETARRNVAARDTQRIKKTSLGTGDYLSREQLARLFEVARAKSYHHEMIIAVMVGSGLRAAELCSLQRRDLGVYGGKSQIDVRRGKGSKQRCVFISKQLSEELRWYLRCMPEPKKSPVFVNSLGRRLRYTALYKSIKQLGFLAGIPTLHPHTLRHTFGTLLYHNQKDLFFVKEQLGHSKVDTTQIYAKTLTESKLEQINAFGKEIAGLRKPIAITEKTRKPEKST